MLIIVQRYNEVPKIDVWTSESNDPDQADAVLRVNVQRFVFFVEEIHEPTPAGVLHLAANLLSGMLIPTAAWRAQDPTSRQFEGTPGCPYGVQGRWHRLPA